jgi:hypothetical protein
MTRYYLVKVPGSAQYVKLEFDGFFSVQEGKDKILKQQPEAEVTPISEEIATQFLNLNLN